MIDPRFCDPSKMMMEEGNRATIRATRLPKGSLYFRFYGESFDPDEITQRLGTNPTVQRRPGDPITKGDFVRWAAEMNAAINVDVVL